MPRPATFGGSRLPDGTPFFGQLGVMARDPEDDRVQCHLCGQWFRMVGGTHLVRTHGWTLEEYRESFQLLKSETTCSAGVSAGLHRRAVDHDLAKTITGGDHGQRRPPVAGWRRMATQKPELLRELHPTRNPGVDPLTIPTSGAAHKYWWRCASCGHSWQATPAARSSGTGCPRCAAKRRAEQNRARNTERAKSIRRAKTLAKTRPDLFDQLHPSRNGSLDLSGVFEGSRQLVWWQCPICGSAWEASPYGRRDSFKGCASCAARDRGAREHARVWTAQRKQTVVALASQRMELGISANAVAAAMGASGHQVGVIEKKLRGSEAAVEAYQAAVGRLIRESWRSQPRLPPRKGRSAGLTR